MDQSLKVIAIADDVSEAQYQDLKQGPGKQKLDVLKQLLIEYLKKPIELDLKLNVNIKESKVRLGDSWNELGVTSNLGQLASQQGLSHPITLSLLD